MAKPITKYVDDDGNEHDTLHGAEVADRFIAAREVAARYVSTLDLLPKQQMTMKTNTLHGFVNWLIDNEYYIVKQLEDSPDYALQPDALFPVLTAEDNQPDPSLFDGATGTTTMNARVGVYDVA